MTFIEPPVQPDDTQPNQALHDTQPVQASKTRPLSPWLIISFIIISGLSLIGTFSYALSRTAPRETRIETQTIYLRVNGVQQEVQSTAATVGDVIQAQAVTIGANDLVFPAQSTPLTDGMVITIARARTVTVTLNGDERTIETPLENPADILQQAQIDLTASDRIFVDGSRATINNLADWTVPASDITVQQFIRLTIQDDGTETILETTAETVGDVLFEENIDVFLTDSVSPDFNTAISDNMTIIIERARPVTINVDDERIETRVQGTTVTDALAEAGIALAGLDYTIPALTETISADMTINVLRVTETIESTDSPIPFETVYRADNTLELDQQQVVTAGQTGTERLNERVRFENGIEVSREPINTEVITDVQNQVVAYGTNIVLRTVDTPEGTREYWRVIRAYATSYHPEALGGDNITAIGMELQKGVIAANPDVIPYRTNLYVPGYGTGTMADTGGTRSSPYWVDLGYSDEDWVGWSQYVDVYLLTPVPAEIDYLLPGFRPMRGIPDN